MTHPDYLIAEAEDLYHARSRAGEFLSSHMLADFRTSPAKYKLKLDGILVEPEREAFAFGRAAHCMILEGAAAFETRYTVADGPVNPRTGKAYGVDSQAYKEWKADQTGDVVATADYERIRGMYQAVMAHPEAPRLLDGIVAEAVVRADYAGEPCQIRMDGYNERTGIVDLKTTGDLSGFYWDISRYGYQFQGAFYRQVLLERTKIRHKFFFIAVEKDFPYTVGVWFVYPDVLDQAEFYNRRAIEQLRECRRTGCWPTGYEDIRTYERMID